MTLDVHKLDARYETLKNERSGWDATWQTLARVFLPTRWRSDTDESSYKQPRIDGKLVNSTGLLAARTLAAGLHGGMTSPVRPWFRLRFPDEEYTGVSGANAWLDEVTQRMQFRLHQSNFYDAVHALYSDLVVFGCGLLIETADEKGLRFDLARPGEFVLDTGERGRVDTFFRRLHMTARQIVERWGESSLPECIRNAARDSSGGEVLRFNVIHGVFPRKDLKAGAAGAAGKPWVSVYWLHGGAAGAYKSAILKEGGFRSFPAFAPRWDVVGLDVYGRSPAMDVLPHVLMLQKMSATLIKSQHKIADPPMLGDFTLKQFTVDLNPGGFTYGNLQASQGRPLLMPVQQPDPSALGHIMTGIQNWEQVVNTGMYSDLFRLMIDDERKQITATEIQAKQNEKMLLLGPVVERLHAELLAPLISRTYMLMRENFDLPAPPEEMRGAVLDVHFESVLAQAQRLMSTSAIDQGLAFVSTMASVKPEAMDIIDGDGMARSYLERVGVPESCLADEQDVEAIRAARMEAQQQQQQQMQAQQAMQGIVDASSAAKNLGQTPVGADGETLMGTLLGGLGGA